MRSMGTPVETLFRRRKAAETEALTSPQSRPSAESCALALLISMICNASMASPVLLCLGLSSSAWTPEDNSSRFACNSARRRAASRCAFR